MPVLLKLVFSHWTYHALAIIALGALGGLWRHERGESARVAAAYEQKALEAVNAALEEQAKGWASVYAAQQEAVARMAAEAGVAAANAREWKRRYDAASQSPKCQAWKAQAVECPVD